MKILKKSSLFIGAAILFANFAIAESGNLNGSYPQLHVDSVAEGSYRSFLNGTGEDPFKELAHGYRSGYSQDIEQNIRPLQYDSLVEKSVEQFEANARYFSEVSEYRDEKRAALYREAFNSEGEFDPVAYAELYSMYLDGERSEVDNHMDSGFTNLIGIMDDNNTALGDLSSNVSVKSSEATINLVNALNNEGYAKKMEMYASFSESLGIANNMANQASSTIALAATFSDDCGSACTFPEVPPEITPQEPPVAPPVYNPPPPPVDCFDGRYNYWGVRDGMPYFYSCP